MAGHYGTSRFFQMWKAHGWEVFIHPTGVLYYHNAKDKVTTSVDLLQYSPTDINLPAGPMAGDFAEYERMKSISFLDEDPAEFQRKLQGGRDLRSSTRYWAFIQNYPSHYPNSEITVQDQAWAAARDALQCCYADRLLFGRVNSTFSKQDSKELLELLISMHKGQSFAWEFTKRRLNHPLLGLRTYTNRVMTSYGQPDASELRRREREETPHTIEKHTWPIAAVYYFAGSILCLGVPHAYFARIQRVDRTRFGDGVSAERWRSFISSLLKEWRDSTLVATVLLAYARHCLLAG
ncbi:hypothetical protein AURDEDRAFT_123677 [Auricularia subglabra TFB-10046 SS5]|nr:hypothetical protein AURDEDRAFT_123677 [Auricularia subglabra TFB-10046 SS5]